VCVCMTIDVPTERAALARVALQRLGLIGGQERDRRPNQDEINRVTSYTDNTRASRSR